MSKVSAEKIFEEADAKGWRRVLIVTALPLETKAVRAHVSHLGHAISRDGSFLELGHFTSQSVDWLVVFAESGAGTHEAQGVVQNVFTEFEPFELSMFVGVAGGRKTESVIGAVVASSEVYMAHGGKWSDGGFNSRPDVRKVDTQLVNLVKKVERDAEWQGRIRPPLKGELPGDDLYPKPRPPNAFIAPIISVEAVSADPNSELEAQITKHYNDSFAVEMEGYGFLFVAERERTPGIVIRGISDERKNKQPGLDVIHQPVAAVHAAAFAFAAIDLWGTTYERQPIMPRIPGPSRTQAPQALAPTKPATNPERETITFVMNFKGTESDFPAERQASILQALRTLTGDESLEIVGTEPGSYRLILKGADGNLEKLNSPEVYSSLDQKLGATLIGLMSEREYRSTADAQQALFIASGPLMDWPQTLPDKTWIDRPELGKLIETLESEDGSTTALIGDPGSGKTALLARFAHTLKTKGVPFLAIKADLLDPVIATEDDLRKHLDLNEIPSATLTRLSHLRPVVLIVDQLDALAGYVDLRTGRLSALLNLVRKLGLRRNIHIILSARAFEYAHDTRLKTVQADSLILELPAWSDILKVLDSHGIKADGWPTDAQEVMRSPQALATFVLFNDKATVEPFLTYQAMLEKLWQDRIISQPNGGRVARLAGRIAEDMAERETLWIATSKYDDQAAELEHLLANGILANPGTPASIGFSHQTVFEYALARAFAQKEGRLSSYVLNRESSLFVRPKLWAALTYLRAVEQSTYLTELAAIWSHKNLRRHLRYLLIEFIGQQSSPLEGEGALMDQAINSVDRRVCLQAMISSSGWFNRYVRNVLPEAMVRSGEADVAARNLIKAWSHASDGVTALLDKYWLTDKDYDGYTWHVLEEAPTWTDAHLEMASIILTRTSIAPFAFEHTILTLGAEQPLMAARLALARLTALLKDAALEAERRASLPKFEDNEHNLVNYHERSPREPLTEIFERLDGWDGLEAVAKQDPGGFLFILWPWFKEALATLRTYEESEPELGFPLQYSLDFRFDEEHSHGLREYAILGALRTAAEGLATSNPEAFLAWLKENECENSAPAQRLFAHTLAGFPKGFATTSLEFLLSDKRRLYLGDIEDVEGTTKRLVKAVSPFWNDAQLARFGEEVLAYAPKPPAWRTTPKQRRRFQKYLAQLKLHLLEALPQKRLTKELVEFVKEQRRRFGSPPSVTHRSKFTHIDSIMSANEFDKAKDEDVINAFRQLPDATGWDNPSDWMKGGNIQLAQAFADFAKTAPERAVAIIKKMTPDIGTRAAGYALNAMAENASPELILKVTAELEARGFAGDEYRGSVARAIQRLIQRDVQIDDGMLELIAGWLADGKSKPSEEEAEDGDELLEENEENTLEDVLGTNDQQKPNYREGSVLWGKGGIYTLPHGNFPILEVITRILLQKRDYDALLTILLEHLERPEEEKVWASLLRLFRYIRPKDTTVLETFLTRLFEKYPGFSHTREAAIFLAFMHWHVPDFVRSVLLVWKSSDAILVQQAFGEMATLVWLMQPDLEWPNAMIEEILKQGAGPARTGATYAAVHVWAETEKKDRASKLLERIIPSADEAAWSAVIDLFRLVDDITADAEWIQLLEAIAERISFHAPFTSTFIVDSLQSLLPHQAVLVAKIAKALITQWRHELSDASTSKFAVAPELVDIAITLHRLGPDTRDIGIEIFEDLLDTNAYTASETLSQIDNRFRSTPGPARRRLPRRERRPRKRARR